MSSPGLNLGFLANENNGLCINDTTFMDIIDHMTKLQFMYNTNTYVFNKPT